MTRTEAILAAITTELEARRGYLNGVEPGRNLVLVIEPGTSEPGAWIARVLTSRPRTAVWRAEENLTPAITVR